MSQEFEKAFQAILNAEMKRSVFASFSNVKTIPGSSKEDLTKFKSFFEGAAEKLKKNEVYKAARESGIPPDTIKKMILSAFDKATQELRLKLDFLFDLQQ